MTIERVKFDDDEIKENLRRRDRAANALISGEYCENDEEGSVETGVIDLIADLLHLAAANQCNTSNILRIATGHFEAERIHQEA